MEVCAREKLIALEMKLTIMIKGKRNKRERANIEERNDDNVNRYFQQKDVQPGMHAHIVYIKSIEFKFKIFFNIIDFNYDLMFFKKI